LWIAKVTDDEKTKHDELSIVLSNAPNNLEALRLLMVLNGRLTPEQAAQTYHDHDPQLRPIGELNAKATDLICPTCGGDLTITQSGRVECRSCGYSAPQTRQPANASGDLLSMALLERKAQPIRWNVGQRLIQCQQCGAEQTIPATKMSQRCWFCGANAVIISDALGSFTQPEELLTFRLDEAHAAESINHALNSLGERLAGWLGHRQIERRIVEGVYLPFWIFDAMIEVTRVKTIGGIDVDRSVMADMQPNVAVCAVKSPSRELTAQLNDYDFAAAVRYEPKWLASYPAQLYCIDFDAASLDAHARIAEITKRKYAHRAEEVQDFQHDRNPALVQLYPQVQSMSFRLALLPVWIATLTIAGGSERLALVNGQTGSVALGQPHRQSAPPS
jgi:Zn finger protein HypA/HybF involved in hydrogenase expression